MKTLPLILILAVSLSVVSCNSKSMNVERRIENGVEVVINHATSTRLHETRPPLRLEELFVIDTENAELTQLGITDIWGFDVDSAEEIFVFKSPLSQGDLIYKFDPTGHFVSSFGRKGEGPGELQSPISQRISMDGKLSILDSIKRKILMFDSGGKLLSETPIKPRLRSTNLLIPLKNDYYLFRRVDFDSTHPDAKIALVFSIVDREFLEIRELDRLSIEDVNNVSRFRYPIPFIRWAVSEERLFLANDERGYEIRSYDLGGGLLRKIRKEGPGVKYPESMKQEVLKDIDTPPFAFLKTKIEFADPAPPYQQFWADDEGRLYVMTYEQGTKPGEYMIDIFDRDGVFMGQMSLNMYISMNLFSEAPRLDSWTSMKKNRLYCLREKETGYIQLVVYRVHWMN